MTNSIILPTLLCSLFFVSCGGQSGETSETLSHENPRETSPREPTTDFETSASSDHLQLGPVAINNSIDTNGLSVSCDGTIKFAEDTIGSVSTRGVMVVDGTTIATLNADGSITAESGFLALIQIDAAGNASMAGHRLLTVDPSGRVANASGSTESGLRYQGNPKTYQAATFVFFVGLTLVSGSGADQ